MRILFSGGGTLGSVTPLLAIAEVVRQRQPDTQCFWLGTARGPERTLVEAAQIIFRPIVAGKLRRYWSLATLLAPFRVAIGWWQSIYWLVKWRPDCVVVAGGFVAVPVVWAAWLVRIPTIVHQQDVVAGLANKLMAPFAKVITVTFESSLTDYPKTKTRWTGNPVRPSVLSGSRARALTTFGLAADVPTVLVVGGGTGAESLNTVVGQSAGDLSAVCQIVHVTGIGKTVVVENAPRYHQYPLLIGELADALAIADVVVTRAGLGFLSELAALQKAVVIVALPGTQQEQNAALFGAHGAARVVDGATLTASLFTATIRSLVESESDRANVVHNISHLMKAGAAETLADIVTELTVR